MTHQVLARKWRPRTFDELAGQDHVRRALVNGLDNGRIHHAYLFTGTRGVGKTTVARILAKCLNCETNGVSSLPCGQCHACTAIDDGRFVDLIEVDAASRTKVEDTRELLDNVQYAPSQARYKIYIVDEVHMLSGHSFNALLKTLEEPPDHVKFLLATTDPHKLPVTILSRCLQFNLKHLPVTLIAEHLRGILEAEGMTADEAAIKRLAQAADGSVRDGLSLLDQALAFGGGDQLADEAVRDMLGSMDQGQLFALLEAAAQGDGGALLAAVSRMAEHACDFSEALSDMLGILHQVAVAQTAPEALDPEAPAHDRIRELASTVSPEACQLFYDIGVQGRRDLNMAPDSRTGFEMTVLRMLAFRPADEDDAAAPPAGGAAPDAPAGVATTGAAGAEDGGGQTSTASLQAGDPEPEVATAAPESHADAPWSQVVSQLRLSGMARGLADHCFVIEWQDDRVKLGLASSHEHLLNQSMQERLEAALRSYYGQGLRLTIELREQADVETPAAVNERVSAERQAAAERAINEDPQVNALKEAFDAEVAPDSVRPRDEP
jgi:DNA polymerase-3 subunit gamma/tau